MLSIFITFQSYIFLCAQILDYYLSENELHDLQQQEIIAFTRTLILVNNML